MGQITNTNHGVGKKLIELVSFVAAVDNWGVTTLSFLAPGRIHSSKMTLIVKLSATIKLDFWPML